MKRFFKISAAILAVLVGLRLSGRLLLFMDLSSDVDVLLGFTGLVSLLAVEGLVFWALFRQAKVPEVKAEVKETK